MRYLFGIPLMLRAMWFGATTREAADSGPRRGRRRVERAGTRVGPRRNGREQMARASRSHGARSDAGATYPRTK